MTGPNPRRDWHSITFAWLLAAILAVDSGLFAWALSGDGYAPAWSDEFGYVGEAVSFSLFGDFKVPGTYYEQLSAWWECGFHGPVYAGLDGSAAWLTGWKWNFKLLVNVAAVLGGLLLAWLGFRHIPQRRSMALVVVLTGFVLPIYLFTYMQEPMQVPIAVAAAVLFLRSERQAPGGAGLLAWSALGLLSGLARLTWVFLMAPLPFITRPRPAWRLAGAIAAFSVLGIALLASNRLIAPFPENWLAGAIEQGRRGGWPAFASLVGRHFADNAAAYFGAGGGISAAYVASRYWMFLLFVGALGLGGKLRRPSMLAAGLLGILTWLAVCAVYDVVNWREQRVLAPCALTCALTIVASASRPIAATVASVSAVFWIVAVTQFVPGTIREHKGVASAWRESGSRIDRVRQMALAFPAGEESVVLVPPEFHRGDAVGVLATPLAGPESRRIRYTANHNAPSPAEAYVRHGRMPVRFAIAHPSQIDPAWPVLATVDGWAVFRLPDVRDVSDLALGRRMEELEIEWRDAETLRACEAAWTESGQGAAVVTAIRVLLRRGQEQECQAWLARGLAEEPDSPQLLLLDGLLRTRRGDEEEALQCFERSARAPAREVDSRIAIGRILRRRGAWKEAGESFRRALSVRSGDPSALAGMAEVLLEEGKLGEAQKCLAEALRSGAPDPEIYVTAGRFLERTGQPAAARQHYERALTLDPKHPEARQGSALDPGGVTPSTPRAVGR